MVYREEAVGEKFPSRCMLNPSWSFWG